MKFANSYYKRLLIAAGVLALVGLLLLGFSLQKSNEPVQLDARSQNLQKLEEADENMIAAALDVYYSNENEYPLEVQSVIQYQEDQNKDIVQGGIDRMTNRRMVYIVSKDRQTYSFNYKSVDGRTISHDGSYNANYR